MVTNGSSLYDASSALASHATALAALARRMQGNECGKLCFLYPWMTQLGWFTQLYVLSRRIVCLGNADQTRNDLVVGLTLRHRLQEKQNGLAAADETLLFLAQHTTSLRIVLVPPTNMSSISGLSTNAPPCQLQAIQNGCSIGYFQPACKGVEWHSAAKGQVQSLSIDPSRFPTLVMVRIPPALGDIFLSLDVYQGQWAHPTASFSVRVSTPKGPVNSTSSGAYWVPFQTTNGILKATQEADIITSVRPTTAR